MNAEKLLEHYDKVADALDAVARLRKLVLDLAVRGKLVEQNAMDEPAAVLLNRMNGERKTSLKIAKREPAEWDALFPALPLGWTKCTIDEVAADHENAITDGPFGSQLKTAHYVTEPGYRVIRLQNVGTGIFRDEHRAFVERARYERLTKHHVKSGDLVVAGLVDDFVRCCKLPVDIGPALVKADCYRLSVHPLISSQYILYFLNSRLAQELASIHQHGMTLVRIGLGNFRRVPVPLPPVAEQKRIVRKVDELMALCDRLEAARGEREITRDRLAAASLARLSALEPDTFRADARFALSVLPDLTARADQIKQLRQTILNLAVRGKLVAQDPKDEHSTKLIARILNEKARSTRVGETRTRDIEDCSVKSDASPDELPAGWTSARLGDLCHLITKGSSPKWQGVNYVSADQGLLFITSENVGNYTLRKVDDLKYVDSKFRDIEPRSLLQHGDILMNLVGASIGRTALYDLSVEANINQAVALIRLVNISNGLSVPYLLHYLNSPLAIRYMLGSRVTTAQPNMSLTDAREFPILIPPVAEQHRIVEAVGKLERMCDDLEQGILNASQQRSNALSALLS